MDNTEKRIVLYGTLITILAITFLFFTSINSNVKYIIESNNKSIETNIKTSKELQKKSSFLYDFQTGGQEVISLVRKEIPDGKI